MHPRTTLFALVSLALITSPTLAVAQDRPLTRWEQQARAMLKELVEHNTTHVAGDQTAASEAMARHMLAAGFPREDVVVIESGAPKKGNLIVRYRGRNPALKPILLLSHIDVVEANPEDWTLPPFEFIEQDGMFFGRGVADDKDEGAIHLTILLRLKAEGIVPERDIIVALTADEESGPHRGVPWLLANRPDLIDAEYALNEGGGGRMAGGVRISHDIQASEKMFVNFELEVTNPGGHSSVPVPDNAIYHLAEALSKLSAYRFPVRLNEVTRAYFSRVANLVEGETAAAMRAIVANPADSRAAAVLAASPMYNSQLRTTCVATMLTGGHATNALPQRARANVNCRLLPDDDQAGVHATLDSLIANPKVMIRAVRNALPSPASPLTPTLLDVIEALTEEMWPGVPVVPSMSTGGTDSQFLRSAGIPAYGVSGLFYENPNAHGMNERISAQAFYEGLEFMYRLVRRLTGAGVT